MSRCPATLPEVLRAEPRKKKHPFLFQKEITLAKTEKQGVFFFRGCRAERGGGGEILRAYDLISHYHARGACTFADIVIAEIAFTDFGNRCELGIIETQNKNGLL